MIKVNYRGIGREGNKGADILPNQIIPRVNYSDNLFNCVWKI